MTYNHKEAFCLMWYACRKCAHRERIWNSRDGVTPFGCTCPSCGAADLLHEHWHLDACTPDHKLRPGQKFFRDGTPDEAEATMRRRIDKMKGSMYEPSAALAKELIARAREGDEDSEFRAGWPVLDTKGRDA